MLYERNALQVRSDTSFPEKRLEEGFALTLTLTSTSPNRGQRRFYVKAINAIGGQESRQFFDVVPAVRKAILICCEMR
jgi:hypothetical protein